MAWAIGAGDVANSMGTSVGAGALTVGGAILIAGVFEFLGAFLAGGEVTSTIRKGIIDAESLGHDPDLLVIGMLSALLAAAGWLTLAEIAGVAETRDALYWVEHATRHADEIREAALERLVRNAVLEPHDNRYLWIFGTRRYSVVDAEVERELKQRINAVLLSDVIPDPRDIVIITLADGCGLVGPLLSADDLARAAPRIELVRQMDLIGRAFLSAMDMAVQPAAGKLD